MEVYAKNCHAHKTTYIYNMFVLYRDAWTTTVCVKGTGVTNKNSGLPKWVSGPLAIIVRRPSPENWRHGTVGFCVFMSCRVTNVYPCICVPVLVGFCVGPVYCTLLIMYIATGVEQNDHWP